MMDVRSAVEPGHDAEKNVEPRGVIDFDEIEHAVVESGTGRDAQAAAAVFRIRDHRREQRPRPLVDTVHGDCDLARAKAQNDGGRHQHVGNLAELLGPARSRCAMADGRSDPERNDQIAKSFHDAAIEAGTPHFQKINDPTVP
jgi:hypothetical protein